MFIVLDGLDGCGKTTQAKLLRDYYVGLGKDVLLTKQPGGGGMLSELLRGILLDNETCISSMTEFLLFQADRAEHVRGVILPALAENKIVICDRYIDSAYAYQWESVKNEICFSGFKEVIYSACSNLFPDITFYLYLPVELSIKRVIDRHNNKMGNRIDCKSIEFHTDVMNKFDSLFDQSVAFNDGGLRGKIMADNTVERIHESIVGCCNDMPFSS